MLDHQSMIGSIIGGRYLLISIIGQGGMAVVFNAFDRKTGNTVAVKILNEKTSDPLESESLKKQFINEALAHSRLSHPGIVDYVGASLKSSPMYFVMEYVDGITLKEYIKRKKVLPAKEVINFSCQILSALNHIHEKGIVHCDIKPHNIMLTRSGKLKLTDFGIARISGETPELPKDKAVGTVYYVSPEQAEGKILDHRSDIYSLGIMMYEMATGKLPFVSNDLDRVAEMQSVAPPKRPRTINSGVSKGLEQIILKAIAKKPYMRFEDANDMRKYLEILRRNPNSVFRLQTNSLGATPSVNGHYHSSSTYAVLAGICAAFIISAAIAVPWVYGSILKGTGGDTVALSLPDLRGKEYEDVIKKVDDRYYDIDVIYVYNSDSAPGVVVSQSPAPNTKLEINPFEEQCKLTISVSSEVRELTVIDITSLSPEDAATALRREGYTVKFQTIHSDTVTKGLTCGTFPSAGSKALGGSEIILYISLGPQITEVKMPSFVSLSESETIKILNQSGLTVGKVTYQRSNLPIGTVISQSVPEGNSIPEGTPIDFTVSGGPDYRS